MQPDLLSGRDNTHRITASAAAAATRQLAGLANLIAEISEDGAGSFSQGSQIPELDEYLAAAGGLKHSCRIRFL